MSFQKLIIACVVLFLGFTVASAKAEKSTEYYKQRAQILIGEARTLGPDKGYTKLNITNPENGATGAAARVAKEDPKSASLIMLDVGEAFIDLAGRSQKTGGTGYPQKGNLYSFGLTALQQSLKYAAQVAKTDPLEASNMAIKVAMVLNNSAPSDRQLGNKYRYDAKIFLNSGNSLSAKTHANKIQNKETRALQMQRIENQARGM